MVRSLIAQHEWHSSLAEDPQLAISAALPHRGLDSVEQMF